MSDVLNVDAIKTFEEAIFTIHNLKKENAELRHILMCLKSDCSEQKCDKSTETIDRSMLSGHDLLGRKGKILVIGGQELGLNIMMGIARKIGFEKRDIPKATISAYENDNIDFKASRLADLARALCTTPNYLLGFEDGEKDEAKEMAETIAAIMGGIKDEKVRKLLLAQMQAAVALR